MSLVGTTLYRDLPVHRRQIIVQGPV